MQEEIINLGADEIIIDGVFSNSDDEACKYYFALSNCKLGIEQFSLTHFEWNSEVVKLYIVVGFCAHAEKF